MRKTENHCVGCAGIGLRCLGWGCSNRDVEVCYCDRCGEEVDADDIREIDGEEICYDCRLEMSEEKGFRPFFGKMKITPKSAKFPAKIFVGEWEYRPETDCWYGCGQSFPADICEILEETT